MTTPLITISEKSMMSENGITNCIKRVFTAMVSATLLVTFSAYSAVDVTWGLTRSDVGYSSSVYASTASGGDYTYTGNDGDVDLSNDLTMTISGWAETGQDPSGGILNYDANLIHYGHGLGLYRSNIGDSDHEIDNLGPDEFIVFRFNEPVSLASYSFGWVDTDADSTLLAYDPNDDGFHDDTETNSSLGLTSSDTIGDLVSNGWNAVGHYAGNNTAPQTVDTTTETSDIFSSYWIIGAYLSDITPLLSGGLNQKDAFKLSSIGVMRHTPPDTPNGEAPIPSSAYLLLLGLAVFGRRLNNLHIDTDSD